MTVTATKMTPEQTLAALQQARTKMLDPLDVPRTWTQRQVNEYEERRRLLDLHAIGISSELDFIAGREARRASLQAGLERLSAVELTIEKLIADAPDWRTLADGRARDKEWARQQTLIASKRALHRGVEYFDGQPALPTALRELLTDTCATCGHAELQWPGPIDALEQEIAELTKTIAERRVFLDSHMQGAAALLAEPELVAK